MKKRNVWLGAVCVGVAVSIFWGGYLLVRKNSPEVALAEDVLAREKRPDGKARVADRSKRLSLQGRMKEKANKRRRGRMMKGAAVSMFERMSEADRKLCEAAQAAMDADDVRQTVALAKKLMRSSDSEARSHAVDTLGWFGVQTLAELTVFMGDANEEVAQNAINTWESGFSEIEEASTRLKVSKMALEALYTKDALESIGSQFSIAATEYIDEVEDEKVALSRRTEVLQSLVDMIDSSKKTLSDVGRDLYEEITGHNWISTAEAELYLKDPDNYEPPEEQETDE